MSAKNMRALPKRKDGEILSRRDIQFDLLSYIFADNNQVFTNPVDVSSKVCFRALYINTILLSPKCSKASRDRIVESPIFGTDFSMLTFLANVGKINTSMSFFPEMKTAIRTYHPVPALQRTSGNLTDAPRLRAILKTAFLESEAKSAPSTPGEILSRASSGQMPPTSIANLIFVLSNHSKAIGQAHLSGVIEFLDLFCADQYSSESRAKMFLWLCHHYLQSSEDDEDNYDDEPSSKNPFSDTQDSSKPPRLAGLQPQEILAENVDPPGEIELGARLVAQRNKILGVGKRPSSPKRVENDSVSTSSHSDHRTPAFGQGQKLEEIRKEMDQQIILPPSLGGPTGELQINHYVDPSSRSAPVESHRFQPYPRSYKNPRTMLEQTWRVVMSADSDDDFEDPDFQRDYCQRLRIITHLRGKAATPEPERQIIPAHI